MLKLSLLALLCCSLIAGKFLHVNGGQRLIDLVCSRTPYPDDCQRCFLFDPNRFNLHVKGLGFDSLACSYSQTANVSVYFDQIAKGTNDSAIYQKAKGCLDKMSDAAFYIEKAQKIWYQGYYKMAATQVGNQSMADYWKCQEEFQGVAAPPSFGPDFETLKRYYQNAIAVLWQI